jgi:hypothetical protein
VRLVRDRLAERRAEDDQHDGRGGRQPGEDDEHHGDRAHVPERARFDAAVGAVHRLDHRACGAARSPERDDESDADRDGRRAGRRVLLQSVDEAGHAVRRDGRQKAVDVVVEMNCAE